MFQFTAPAPPDGFAVIVWLHSGDFSSGSPFELNPFQLVFKQKVIVATVAFRLNIMGFFTTMDGESPGNFGLHDQSAALMWLKKNIKLFGGNEETMTLMGHGAGAASASLHLTSKERSEGLFSKAIIMSGSSLVDTVVRTPSYYTKAIDRTAHEFACYRTPTTQLIDCLRRVAAKILVETAPDQHWGPIIDEGLTKTPFISDAPHILIERGFLRSVPIMIGFTDMEEAFDLMAEDMIESGISHELYDSMLSEIVVTDFARYESNESMCPGNNQVAMEAVNFLYQPYPPTTDKLMLRKFYLDFINDRKYLAPTILMAGLLTITS